MQDIRRKAEISEENRRLALKLFTQQSTYQAGQYDQAYKQHKKQLKLLQRVEKRPIKKEEIKPMWQSEFNLPPIKNRIHLLNSQYNDRQSDTKHKMRLL